MAWHSHIDKLSKKFASGIGAIERIGPFGSPDILHYIYNALVQPHFNNCSIVWGNRGKTLSEKLQKLDAASSETQGRSVGPGEKARRKFLNTGRKAPGYRLSPDHFQKVERMLAPDWAQKMLCVIVPNRRAVSPEFFS